jgi:hypothetical protein
MVAAIVVVFGVMMFLTIWRSRIADRHTSQPHSVASFCSLSAGVRDECGATIWMRIATLFENAPQPVGNTASILIAAPLISISPDSRGARIQIAEGGL